MTTIKRYVLDTTSVISYFNNIFSVKSQISSTAQKIIERGLNDDEHVVLIVPSLCFIEIYDKFCTDEENLAKYRYEVLTPLRGKNQIEIREINEETLKNYSLIDDDIVNLESKDKVFLATAIEMDAILITSDRKIIKYAQKKV